MMKKNILVMIRLSSIVLLKKKLSVSLLLVFRNIFFLKKINIGTIDIFFPLRYIHLQKIMICFYM